MIQTKEGIRSNLLPQIVPKPWLSQTSSPILLTNCLVVDPSTSSLLGNGQPQSILIKAGKIAAIGQIPTDLSEDVQTSDVGGRYVCPGLIDSHVHCTAVPGGPSIADFVRTPEEIIAYRAPYVLDQMLKRGFTTVRDCGGATKNLANALAEGLISGPRLIQCGKALSQTGGHGDFVSGQSGGDRSATCCGGHSVSLGRVADGVPAVLRAVREELKAGADFIKIMCGGGVASETDAIETVQFSPEEVKAITSTCKQMGGKHTTAHAYTIEAIRHAIDNGVLGIEHGNLIDEATAKLMAEKGVFLTPTLSVYDAFTQVPFDAMLNEDQHAKNLQVMEKGAQAIKIADAAGVTICYGSDMLANMHPLQTKEFETRSSILPAATILKHATINGAKMLRFEGKLGIVAEGAIADLIFLDQNPLEDITILDRPDLHLLAVMQAGRWSINSF
ncbi:hypothetical protein P7C73_g1134, partial [Tremellales sp. Uapishka_1]